MTEDAQMKIRLPRALKEQIDAAAEANKRTLNGEIVARLEMTFVSGAKFYESGFDLPVSPAGDAIGETLEQRVASLEEKMRKLLGG
jgi:hypothetical protein